MTKILSQKPKFIVKKKFVWYLSQKTAARLLLEKTLSTNYELVKEIQRMCESPHPQRSGVGTLAHSLNKLLVQNGHSVYYRGNKE